MLRPRTPLFNAATDAPDAGGSGDAQPKATIGQTIKAALASKADLQAKLELATTDLTARDATIATLQADLAAAQARVTALEAEAAEINTALTAHQAEVVTLKAAEQDLAKRASTQAKAIVQSVGIEASKLPAATNETVPDVPATEAALKAQINKPGMTFAQKRVAVAAFDAAQN